MRTLAPLTRFLILAGLILAILPLSQSRAQENLLRNGDMEGGFSARDNVAGVPLAWVYYVVAGNVGAEKQFAYARSGTTSWAFKAQNSAWRAGGLQTVNATPGAAYRFVAHALIWTCDNVETRCGVEGGRASVRESGARVRVGVHPSGGTNANSPEIAWGEWTSPFDAYGAASVDVLATGDRLTVFLMGDGGAAMAFNEIYWEDAALFQIDAGSANPANPTPDPDAEAEPEPQILAPQVPTQQARPDGSVVHRVGEGDTFFSIVVAYEALGATTESVLALNNLRHPPSFISIGDDFIILPPGSVNPATGELIPAGQSLNTAPPPREGETEQAAPPQTTDLALPPLNPSAETPSAHFGGAAPASIESLTRRSSEQIRLIEPTQPITPFLPVLR